MVARRMADVPRASVPLSAVVREWGRIGVIGFGGPPAHVALLRELVVERRGWMSAREFEDANAACGLLPGPASTQLAIYCAHRAGGVAGALAGGASFILPGLVAIIAIAAVALAEGPPVWIRAVGAGAGAAVVAVVLDAAIALGRASLGGLRGARLVRAALYLAAGAAATAVAGAGVVLVLLACGLVELGWRRGRGRGARAALHAWPVLAAGAAAGAAALPELAWTALKVGALSYGGGYVIIPLMEADAVDAYGWMTPSEFVDAVAFGQLTPGPVVHTVAVVGYAAAGPGGALLAAAVAFAPSFAMVLAGGPRFAQLRASAAARAFLDGAGPAAVGAIAGAVVPLATALEKPWQLAVLVGAGLLLLLRRGALWALVGGALAGLAAAAAGLAIPG
jgi:chromate transporter